MISRVSKQAVSDKRQNNNNNNNKLPKAENKRQKIKEMIQMML